MGEETPRLGEQKLDGGAGGLRARRQRAFCRYCFIARKLIGRANQRGHLAAAHDYSTSLGRVMEGEQERQRNEELYGAKRMADIDAQMRRRRSVSKTVDE